MTDDNNEQATIRGKLVLEIRLVQLASALGVMPWIQRITSGTDIGRNLEVLQSLCGFDDIDELL